jgi:hypothetical protein
MFAQLERYAARCAYFAGLPAWCQPRLANSRKKVAYIIYQQINVRVCRKLKSELRAAPRAEGEGSCPTSPARLTS